MRRSLVRALVVWFTCQTGVVLSANQDTFSKARELYLSADYEGALALLDGLDSARGEHPGEAAAYRVFCLLALDRTDEARAAIKSIVERDPSFRLPEGQASPRMEAVFHETRKTVLPAVVQSMYAEAKASFDKHDAAAVQRFDRLIALLDDPDLKDAQLSDLKSVATAFRDLSKTANRVTATEVRPTAETTDGAKADTTTDSVEPDTTRVPNVAAAVVPSRPLTGPPDTIRVTRKGATPVITAKAPPPPGLEPPLAISQPFPGWSPRGKLAEQPFNGTLEVTINEQGSVTTVALQRPLYPAFDNALLKAARTWKYKPALLNGAPVPYVKVIEIHIQPEP